MANIREYQKYREENAQSEDDGRYTKRLWFHKGRKMFAFLAALSLMIIVALGYRIYLNNRIYTDYEVVSIAEIVQQDNSKYMEFGNKVLRYGVDGITYLDKDNTKIWEIAYQIKYPIVELCGNYGVVAAQRSNEIYIFNQSGIQGSIKAPYAIIDISIASQGVIAVSMEADGMNYINIYEPDGEQKVGSKTSLEGNGYPMDIALSPDGQKLMVAYLDIAEKTLKSSIVFYNFSEVGENYIWNMVGVYDDYYDETIIPYVKFLDGETACAVGDDRTTLFHIKEIPDVQTDIPLLREVRTFFYSEDYIGFVYENVDSGGLYQIEVYDTNGKKHLTYNLEHEYESIRFVKEHILICTENSCKLLTMTGAERFDYTFDKNILLLEPLSVTHYIMITSSTVSEIRLK